MTLRLANDWLWDFWFAVNGDDIHVFFLHAPRTLGDPELRHAKARIGHAVTRDLRSWTLLPRPFEPGPPGAFDDLATWTGSVLALDGAWWLVYTGISSREGGRIQRIGLARSHDLLSWTKADIVLEADPRWYEKAAGTAEEHWRDPWAFEGPDGLVHLLITARANDGPPDGRGVVGHAWSRDLRSWEVGPPLSEPGQFRQLEVLQLARLDGHWRVLFSVGLDDHSAVRRSRGDGMVAAGTHYLVGDGPLGPFAPAGGRFLLGDRDQTWYAGRLLRWRGQQLLFCTVQRRNGIFVGELSDPMPVDVTADGRLSVRAATR